MSLAAVSLPRLADEAAPAIARPAPRIEIAPAPVAPEQAAAPAKESRKSRSHVEGSSDWVLYGAMAVLIGLAWEITRLGLFKANDNVNYWIGVVGGSMMLVLLVYPLRKYVRFMQNLGKVKYWFLVHLFLGIAGPWLILVHSTFVIGSLNAGVALGSMCIVVGSGVIGRFIYVRIHRGLNGELMSLQDLRSRAGMVESEARSRLHFAPTVEARLLAFEQNELNAKPGWFTYFRQVAWLPVTQVITGLRCKSEVHARLHQLANEQGWSPDDLARRERKARKLVNRYLDAVVRVAQYTAYERIFALWHVAHLPFVYLLIISAVVHVVAVHAY
jgi:hypothetical protein